LEYRLLEKTELWIAPVGLKGADLCACARSVGKVLGLRPEEIMVTDAIGERLTLDILVPTVMAENILSKEKEVLTALSEVPGVIVDERTTIHSEGILGLINLGKEEGRRLLERSAVIRDEITDRIRKRALVLSTGAEVLTGQIRDTNTPFLIAALRKEGFTAEKGPVLPDDIDSLAGAMRSAADRGYGLVISTGGIGAEGKDRTLEALSRLDSEAFKPYVLNFHRGQGRHEKDGVRLGVGQYGSTRIVCLPGPHDEVELLWPVLQQGIEERWDNEDLAYALAEALRHKFLKMETHIGGMSLKL
jgi:molybdenum cofactor synthesis domain-containing protein